MNSTISQQPIPALGTGPQELPGRAVDIVAAAAHADGLHLTYLTLWFAAAPGPRLKEISVHLSDRHVGAAQRVIGALGVLAEIGEPYGPPGERQVSVKASVPALGGVVVSVIATQGLPAEPGDPTALITAVDTHRAHQPLAARTVVHDDIHALFATDHPDTRPDRSDTRGGRS